MRDKTARVEALQVEGVSNPPAVRIAVPEVATTFTRHREPTLADATELERDRLEGSHRPYAAWVRGAVERSASFGVLGLDGEDVAAGAGVVFFEWGPAPHDPSPAHARVSNVFTKLAYCRWGWTRRLVLVCAWTRRRRTGFG